MVTAVILIVDDEAPVRDFLTLVLEDPGHRVVAASSGQHALTMAAEMHPNLVISDVMMPLMAGVELTRRLKAGEAGDQAVPVILMSSAGRAASGSAGADAFIDRPFELEAMEKLVTLVGLGQVTPSGHFTCSATSPAVAEGLAGRSRRSSKIPSSMLPWPLCWRGSRAGVAPGSAASSMVTPR